MRGSVRGSGAAVGIDWIAGRERGMGRRMLVDYCLPFAIEVVSRRIGTVQFLRSGEYRDNAQQFYSMARSMSSNGIDALLTRTVRARHEKERGWVEGGVRLPLSVWAQKGWDVATIERCAEPDDIQVCPKYHWTTYRVPIFTDSRGEKVVNSDGLQALRKTRTRALRRRTTDASSKKDASSASGESFSSEDSASSSGEEQPSRKTENKGGKGKAAAKKKASADEKRKTAAKKKANIAFDKVDAPLKTLRSYLSDEFILDVDAELQDSLNESVKKLHEVAMKIKATKKSGICEYDADFAALDFKAFKKLEATLKKKLAKIRRASE